MHTVSFLTDFGVTSGYVAQMKGVVSSLSSQVNMIDISHQIPPQNVKAGAFVLATTVPYLPNGSVHVAVVDPGVGTNRRGIMIVTNKHIFIGPDNGLCLPAARLFGRFKVYHITNESLFQHPVSNTFHGRDIFASVAGHILKGVSFDIIGKEIHDYVDFSFPPPRFEEKTIHGEILFVDDFGNVITNILGNRFLQIIREKENVMIRTNENRFPAIFVPSYDFVFHDDVLITIGSHGYVEFSINQGNAEKKLGLTHGDVFEIVFGLDEIIND